MMENQTNQETLAKLRRLNFEELIHIDTDDAANYTYEKYVANNNIHKIIGGPGGCNKCEINGCLTDASHKLRFISHGAHTVDFLSIHHIDYLDWSDKPILFVLESPGGDGKFYANEFDKKPTRQWYWVHGGTCDLSLDKNIQRKKFGEFFASIINHFKLSDVYVTNLVKCGLARNGKSEFNIYNYDDKVVKNCFSEYLDKELELLKPQAVFAFGGRVYNAFRKRYADKYTKSKNLFCMPHPSARFITQEKYRQIALNHFLIGLYESEIITKIDKENYSQQLNIQ